jgi:cation transport regulator ChaC
LTAQAAAARSQDVIAAATSTRPRYIFGYGSLIERESRMATWPSAQFASPAIVKGVARGWFDQTEVSSWSPTYLGGIAEADAETNGVIFRVTVAEFDSYTQRETGYRPITLK